MIRFTLFLLLFPFSLCAQSLELTMKGGYVGGKATITGQFAQFTSGQNSAPEGDYAGLQASVSLFKGFRLGTEIGLSSFEHSINQKVEQNGRLANSYLGRNKMNTFHFAIVPEYRFLKSRALFINAGLGVYKDLSNNYKGYDFDGIKFEDVDSEWFPRGNDFGAFVGFGFCPHLTKRLGLLLELRYSNLFTDKQQLLGIKYELLNVNIGLRYRIAD